MKTLAIVLILLLFVFSLLIVLQELGKIDISIISKICYYGNHSKLILVLYIIIYILAIVVIYRIFHS